MQDPKRRSLLPLKAVILLVVVVVVAASMFLGH